MGVRAEDFKYVYLCDQRRKEGFPRNRWYGKAQRKIGATSIDSPLQRIDALSASGCFHYDVVKIWHRPYDALAIEWVSKRLLKDMGEDGFEHVNASADTCLEVVERAIKLVEARDFRRWAKSNWPVCLRKLPSKQAIQAARKLEQEEKDDG